MRIAIIYSEYQKGIPSGETQVVQNQYNLLVAQGHQVILITKPTPENPKFEYYVKTFFRVASGIGNSPLREILHFVPDLVLIHNLHPNFSQRWVKKIRAKKSDIRLIVFFHNYRMLCAQGFFIRKNKQCFDCLNKKQWRAVIHKCYRNSVIASSALFIANLMNIWEKNILSNVDAVIYLSEKMKYLLNTKTFEDKKRFVLFNFVDDTKELATHKNQSFVYAGRLSPEKGIFDLVKHWPNNYNLHIYGDGILKNDLIELIKTKPGVAYKGFVKENEIVNIMSGYSALIFPSIWVEVAPLVIIRALSLGLPILTLKHNIFWDDEDSHPGIAIGNLNEESIMKALTQLIENQETFSSNARKFYLARYTPEKWYLEFLKIIK